MYKQLKNQFDVVSGVLLEQQDGKCICIPLDPANTDYQAYLAWLEEGNEPLPVEEAPSTWEGIRAKRDQLIRDSDWTITPDASVNQASWAEYRQQLRDIPQTYAATGPESVVWPEPPSTSGPNTSGLE